MHRETRAKPIVLIQPNVGYLEAFQDAPLHPLALLSVASYLAPTHPIRIIDQRVDARWEDSLAAALREPVLCVGITSMTGPQILHGLQASRIVREHSTAPIVWGGIHPSILPEQTLEHPLVDIVVEGEGEIAFRELIHALAHDLPYHEIPGIWTLRDGRPAGSRAETIPDLSVLPPLPYHLVDMEKYIGRDQDGRRRMAIKTSRGCPYRCYFCHQTGKKGRKWRGAPADQVLSHMEHLITTYGIGCFQILDDSFFVDVRRANAFLHGLAERKWDIAYYISGTRVTDILRMSDETLSLLTQTGCRELAIGLESGSQRMLDHMKKDMTIQQVHEADQRLKRHGIHRYYELVSGHLGETEEDLRETAKLVLELSRSDPNVFFSPLESLTPYPGTGAFHEAVAAGMEFPRSLEEWAGAGWDRGQLPWMDAKRRRLLGRIHILPTVVSSRIRTEHSSLLQALHRIYRPIARFRIRHLFFALPLELVIFRVMSRLRESSRLARHVQR